MIRILRNSVISLLGLLVVTLGSCGGGVQGHEGSLAADSLSAVISQSRYSSLALTDSLARELLQGENLSNERRMIACNALAYSSLMAMDYGKAVELYRSVIENSECEIERLAADVGLMTLCYRVSENRLFFDYRAAALSRMKRIEEEYEYLAAGDKERFNRAKIEFCIVSVCYFSNLAMLDESKRVLGYLSEFVENTGDRALRLYARMMLLSTEENAGKRLSSLAAGAGMAAGNGMLWLEGNYKLLLAIALRDNDSLMLFATENRALLASLLPQGMPLEQLPRHLAAEAVEDFSRYGDSYMMIEAMAVTASCLTAQGLYDEALSQLAAAYDSINGYYSRYYPEMSFSPDSLLLFIDEGGEPATDYEAGRYNIPECMLSVCREASCAYAGLGDKEASDINREAYLELLRTTRMNKMLESRASTVENELSRLRLTAAVALVLLVAVSLWLVILHRRRRNREIYYSKYRRRLLKVSRLLLSSLPHDVDDKRLLCKAVSDILNEHLAGFAGDTSFALGGEPAEGMPFVSGFEVRYMNAAGSDTLWVASSQELDGNRKELVAMLLPYIAVAIEEGLRLADISEEREKVEEARRASAIYLAEHKRENMLKRVSASVVSGMRPFMDRIMNELNALPASACESDRARKLQYVAELTEKLEDLNLILERWIKTRQGELNLRVENFTLSSLFDIIEKNRLILESKGLSLSVRGGGEAVKADKALTLFMINTLVDNAAKFTPEGGSVTLESIEGGDYVEVAVTDTGIGLSASDIERIKGSKVYDASQIGEDNELLQAKSKGGGFGLMNCKGIIEKYRKTDSLFSVCSFDIASVKGKGSRFSFRLPKGVVRCMLLLLMALPLRSAADDTLAERLNMRADSVFMSNVNGNYEEAFVQAREAIDILNSYYKEHAGGTDTLSLREGAAAELSWWRKGLFPDSLNEAIYYNILDIRNELAVASLALNDWDAYRHNNYIYSTLYRLVHEGKGIADRYAVMRQLANNYKVATALSFFIIVLLLAYYLVSFVRHSVIERTNERLVLDMNSRLLRVASSCGRSSVQELARSITDELYACIGETMCVSGVAMLLRSGGDKPVLAESPAARLHGKADIYMQRLLEEGEAALSPDGLTRVMPLNVTDDGRRMLVGVMEIVTERPLSESEALSLELIMGYLASVAYHSAVRVASGYSALEELEEETARLTFEDNRLHVQNMVMDNCLSVIKHETVYYPSRIRELAVNALSSPSENGKAVEEMSELMRYYSSIFGILSNCVARELDGMSFTLEKVGLSQLFDKARRYAERAAKRAGRDVRLVCEDTAAMVSVDAVLVEYLFEQLLSAAMKVEKEGTLTLRAADAGDVVRVELADSRYELTSEEVAELFTPTRRNIDCNNGAGSMEYLVAKEIVRLHEDYTGRHGGRMEARSDVSGTVILFTLPD